MKRLASILSLLILFFQSQLIFSAEPDTLSSIAGQQILKRPIALAGGSSSAVFQGGVADASDTNKVDEFQEYDEVIIAGAITPREDDLGKTASIFIVIRSIGDIDSWTYKNSDGFFEPWGLSIKKLAPAIKVDALNDNETFEIFSGELAPGNHRIYIGYTLDDEPNDMHLNSVPMRIDIGDVSWEKDFVYRDGQNLMLNGDPFYIAGMNSQQALAFVDNGIQDSAIEHAVDYGINVLRIWASSEVGSVTDDSVETVGQTLDFSDPNIVNRPYYQYWDVSTQSVAYNETDSGLLFLDRLIALAGENDIRIIFNLLDNWEWWWGGINQYVIWHGGNSHGEFYTREDIKQTYKNWVSYLLNRENSITGVKYKDDPTIMTWDILNEAGCYHESEGNGQILSFAQDTESQCNYGTIEPWIDEMAAFVKSIDDRHLVSVGAQGHFTTKCDDEQMGYIYCAYNEPDMRKILENPDIDIAAYHMYPYEEGGFDGDGSLTPFEWGVRFIEDRLALSDELNKPVILEEFGATDFSVHEELMDGWISILFEHGKAAFTFYELGAYWGPGTFAAGEPVFGSNGWNMFPDSPSAETMKYWIDQYLNSD